LHKKTIKTLQQNPVPLLFWFFHIQ